MMFGVSEKDKFKIEYAERIKETSARYGISYCTIKDDEYPVGLRELSNCPAVLYYKGNIEIVNRYKNMAVIGSRSASQTGLELAYSAGRSAGEIGLNLVNGLALGCDTWALKGALETGGRCIAILPCGLEQIQPKSNLKLAQEILEKGGCLLSEYPIGTEAKKYQYVERDRLQSGLSQGVLVVEAEEKSGTMHTADFALRQFKRLACYYYKIMGSPSGNRYLEESGKAKIIKTNQDLGQFMSEIIEEDVFRQVSFDDLII